MQPYVGGVSLGAFMEESTPFGPHAYVWMSHHNIDEEVVKY